MEVHPKLTRLIKIGNVKFIKIILKASRKWIKRGGIFNFLELCYFVFH